MIGIAEWKKADLRAAKILEIEDVLGKDKLYKLRVECNGERTLVAGIKPHYTKDALRGKTIIVVSNLEPANIAGIRSEGMLLAVKDLKGAYRLLTADGEVGPGTAVE